MSKMTEVTKFCSQVKQEIEKISWPTRKELVVSSFFVIGVVCLVSVFCVVIDYAMHGSIEYLITIGH